MSEIHEPSTSSAIVEEHRCSKYFRLPQRWILCILASIGVLLAEASRVCLKIAILLNVEERGTGIFSNNTCEPSKEPYKEPVTKYHNGTPLYDWDLQTRYNMIEAYHWGELITQLPGGILSDQFGGTYIVSLSFLLSSFCCLISPSVVILSNGKSEIITMLNAFNGMFQGVMKPALMSILAQWAPESEKATMVALVFSTTIFGKHIAFLVADLGLSYSWRAVFYVFAALGFVWCGFWHALAHSRPDLNPFVGTKERRYLRETQRDHLIHEWKKIPWKSMVLSLPFWALVILNNGEVWGWNILDRTISIYVTQVLKSASMRNTPWWTTFFCYFLLSIIYGAISDWLVSGHHFQVTTVRKFFVVISNFGPAVCLIFITFVRCDVLRVWIYITTALILSAAYQCTVLPNHLDLSSNFAGTLYGFNRGSHKAMRIAGVEYTVTSKKSLTQWNVTFWISFWIYITTALVYLPFGTAVRQEWDFEE